MPDSLETGALGSTERAEYERLQVAIRVACDAVYEWLLSSDKLVWSRNAREMLGLPGEADISDRARFEEFVHPDDRPTFRRVRDGGLESFSPFQIEYRIGSPDGAVRWVHERGAVQRGADGRPERVVGTTTAPACARLSNRRSSIPRDMTCRAPISASRSTTWHCSVTLTATSSPMPRSLR